MRIKPKGTVMIKKTKKFIKEHERTLTLSALYTMTLIAAYQTVVSANRKYYVTLITTAMNELNVSEEVFKKVGELVLEGTDLQ